MERREFIQNIAVTAAGLAMEKAAGALTVVSLPQSQTSSAPPPDATLVAEFTENGTAWKVYEDLNTRDGDLTFISSRGQRRVLRKSAEAAFEEADPSHLGLSMDEIGLSGPDLLADKLLAGGDDPDPAMVKAAAPPQGAPPPRPPNQPAPQFQPRARWDTFVGTREAYDTMPVYPSGNTRTYHPNQYLSDIRGEVVNHRFDGLVGGWMPAVRKVFPISEKAHIEILVFGDVEAHDRFIIQTWHRTARIEDGKMSKPVYGYSYPAYPPARVDPTPEEFYRALLVFADYWDKLMASFAPTSLPDESWVDMAKHAFAKELMVRPGGVYPKYGAVDRDYYGPEYDGFQDIFTMAAYANLECGRFDESRAIIDNYFTDFVDSKGVNNMRGPETAQFGLTLSLMARYFNYTGDAALLNKHRGKILASAALLEAMHEESLKLPKDDVGYGLVHGWSESDACLAANPSIWWLPYFANTAFAARGLQDLGRAWPAIDRNGGIQPTKWLNRSKTLRETTIASMEKDMWRDHNPPYIGTYPGTKLMFRESLGQERPSPQQWAHRPYAELLEADVLPENLANAVIDCMRAYGATTIGVVANVGAARPGARAILGFISYGYAQMLLRLDRVEEYLLFLYSHRYHDHTRGSWVAGEVSGINGGTAIFCIPAQQTIPLLVRWMLVLEDSDEDRLYFAKGVPRDWVASGKPVSIQQAPTRWGRVNLNLIAKPSSKSVVATVELARPGAPKEIQVKLRVPKQTPLHSVTVNGRTAQLAGKHGDTVVIPTGAERHFEVVGQLS
ncbi:MAG TPA: hypothetical protein VKB56_04485 [Terriglobales bacterium]|nr:hypothetical protein [Terriglobales bacterium]